MDEDFLTESRSRTDSDVPFAGVIYSPMSRWPIRRLIDDLELLARVLEPSDMSNRVEYLPLKPP
jgi:hypothetical protein